MVLLVSPHTSQVVWNRKSILLTPSGQFFSFFFFWFCCTLLLRKFCSSFGPVACFAPLYTSNRDLVCHHNFLRGLQGHCHASQVVSAPKNASSTRFWNTLLFLVHLRLWLVYHPSGPLPKYQIPLTLAIMIYSIHSGWFGSLKMTSTFLAYCRSLRSFQWLLMHFSRS